MPPFTLHRPEAAGRDGAAVKSRGAVSEDMPVVVVKGRKCLDNMTVFNQENVEEFYEIGDELGRYVLQWFMLISNAYELPLFMLAYA